MKHRNPFSNRRPQSARARRRQERRMVLSLRSAAAREIKKGLAGRIAARTQSHDVAD